MKTALTHIFATFAAVIGMTMPAYAEAAPAEDGFASLIPLLLIMVIFYFLLIRPQQKKLKEHRGMVDSLGKGDQVITGGGIHGKVASVKDDTLKIEIADGVTVTVQRDTVASLAGAPAPTKEKSDKE